MTHLQIIESLKNNKATFYYLFTEMSDEQITWKPNPDQWCLLEILCHIHDEEIEDFRTRLRYALEQSTEMPPPIDPVGWVTEREYIKQDFSRKLNDFLKERDASIEWLESLENPKWENGFVHTKMGLLTADFYLKNWLAHDYLHFRQITRLKYQYLKEHGGTDIQYAGKW